MGATNLVCVGGIAAGGPQQRRTSTLAVRTVAMAYIVMASIAMAYVVLAYIAMTYVVIAYIAMAYIVMAYTVMPVMSRRLMTEMFD